MQTGLYILADGRRVGYRGPLGVLFVVASVVGSDAQGVLEDVRKTYEVGDDLQRLVAGSFGSDYVAQLNKPSSAASE